jgi:hypothetical protein
MREAAERKKQSREKAKEEAQRMHHPDAGTCHLQFTNSPLHQLTD